MRPTLPIFCFTLILTAAMFGVAAPSTAQTDEEILAEVNEARITHQDLVMETSLLHAELRHRNNPISASRSNRLQRQLLQNLIDRELLYQRALKKKITIRNSWVERAIIDLKTDLKVKNGFHNYLKSAAINEAQLRKRIQKGLIVRRLLRREVIRQVKVTEREMQAFFRDHPEFFQRQEQVRVRQIMISLDKSRNVSQRGDALLRIQSIQKQLQDGANFGALAIDYSEDKSRASGGDLGYLQRSQMIAPLADAAFSLQPGQVSDIVETRLGYHLLLVVDRIPSSKMAYRNARSKIERTLRRNKEKKATDAYLAKLKRQAAIKRLVSF